MKNCLLVCTLFAVLLGGLVATAGADDLKPPWWRGEWSTTSQYWEFYDPYNPPYPTPPIPPDGSPAGGQPWLPSTHLIVDPLGDWIQIDPEGSGREGIWPLSGIIDVVVDNHDPKPENEKWIWMQLTWQPQPGTPGVPIVTASYVDPSTGGQVGPIDLQPYEQEDLGFGWVHGLYRQVLPVNPPDEFIRIEGTINVDELVIDTWCIPEPSTVAMLLGIGLMGLVACARRR